MKEKGGDKGRNWRGKGKAGGGVFSRKMHSNVLQKGGKGERERGEHTHKKKNGGTRPISSAPSSSSPILLSHKTELKKREEIYQVVCCSFLVKTFLLSTRHFKQGRLVHAVVPVHAIAEFFLLLPLAVYKKGTL